MQVIVENIKQLILNDQRALTLSDEKLKEKINEDVLRYVNRNQIYISLAQKVALVQQVYSQIRGYGVLDNLLKDELITEIMINGKDTIFIEKFGQIEKSDVFFESHEQLDDLIQKIVSQSGREVNQANPIVDTRLKNGARVNIVLPPIALNGPIVTIRQFSKEPMTLEKLIAYGAVDNDVAQFLQRLVQAKYNIIVSGGTGTGKTTFLNALSNFIPKTERLITIEDSAELQIKNMPNLVVLETRNANSARSGEITIRDLIKTALRMRPERIVVGEVRGKEAIDMLQAMNTGHDGSLSTVHANSARDVLSRLETMVLMGKINLPLLAIRQQIQSSVDIIVHLSRFKDGSRKVKEIVEIVGMKNNDYDLNQLYQFKVTTQSSEIKGVFQKCNAVINDDKLQNN